MLSVKILVSVPDARSFDACTLVFNTLRTGFPTAKIHVDINGMCSPEHTVAIEEKAQRADCFTKRLVKTVHLGDWIRNAVEGHIFDWPLVILDADTVFWKSVEDWQFKPETLLAGYYNPQMWNDFAKCVSVARLHTSCLWFPNVSELRAQIVKAYPQSHGKAGEYCPCDPFMPAVRFTSGQAFYWDCCANLYQMLGPSRCERFGPEQKECFDHLNSASFYDVMMERMDDNRGFHVAHTHLVKQPELMRNLWPIVDRYYAQKALEGRLVLATGNL